jgi:hypothetical protein
MSTVIGLVRTSLNEQCLPVIERGFYTAQWWVLVIELGNNPPWWPLFYWSFRGIVSHLADQYYWSLKQIFNPLGNCYIWVIMLGKKASMNNAYWSSRMFFYTAQWPVHGHQGV